MPANWRYLTETLISFKKDYQIILIEKIEEVGAEIANKFESVKVLQGDGTDIKVLTDADAENADYYIAVTGKDEDNLVGCHIAKTIFHVRNTVAHVNNPANIELFELLKVDHVYSRSVILADIIEQDIAQEGMSVIYKIPHQKMNILEVELSPTSAAVGKTLAEYDFPDKTSVALLIHDDGRTEVPRGYSIMLEGDRLLLVTTGDDYDEIFNKLVKN
ncbi:MAG: TrkA family potassium uptake protein [Clostridiaceae bacterium]|nr:TrkA family potassium uptake protein [Clostridiaceae bacterium]